jgi:polyhydroxyalkanoate synthesis repressor PhaR
MTAGDGPIQIKRYPNRRFYARQAKAYVSLQDIEQMVRDGHTVEITDSQSGEEITRTVLAQIIMEQHPDKFSLFPTAMLHSILQANEAMSDFLKEYFEQCLTYLDLLRVQGVAAPVQNPMEWMRAWMDRMYPGMPFPVPGWPPRKPASQEDDLRRRMADLEARLRQMEGDASKRSESRAE